MLRFLLLLFTSSLLLSRSLSAQQADLRLQFARIVSGFQLDLDELKKIKDPQDLRLLRNAVYAQYGYIFRSEELRTYFSAFDWYKPTHENVDGFLTARDSINLGYVMWAEADQQVRSYLATPVPGRASTAAGDEVLTGIWHVINFMPSGWAENFCIFPNGNILFRSSQMDCDKRLIYKAGWWSHQGNRFEIHYTHELVMLGGYMIPAYASCGSDSSLENALPLFRPLPNEQKVEYKMSPVETDRTDDRELLRLHLDHEPWWKMSPDPYDWD